MQQRTLMLIGLSLLIAALTLFVSRRFGFTFLFLPLFFAWGGGRQRRVVGGGGTRRRARRCSRNARAASSARRA